MALLIVSQVQVAMLNKATNGTSPFACNSWRNTTARRGTMQLLQPSDSGQRRHCTGGRGPLSASGPALGRHQPDASLATSPLPSLLSPEGERILLLALSLRRRRGWRIRDEKCLYGFPQRAVGLARSLRRGLHGQLHGGAFTEELTGDWERHSCHPDSLPLVTVT